MTLIFHDSTNTRPTKSSALSTVLSLTHALSNTSPTKNSTSISGQNAVNTPPKSSPRAASRNAAKACLALFKPRNGVNHSSPRRGKAADASTEASCAASATASGSNKAPLDANVLPSGIRAVSCSSSLSKKPANLSSPSSKARAPNSARLGATRNSKAMHQVPVPIPGTSPVIAQTASQAFPKALASSDSTTSVPLRSTALSSLSDLVFLESLCRSVLHHWRSVVNVDSDGCVGYDLSEMDRELVKRMNGVLVRNGRRGVLLSMSMAMMKTTTTTTTPSRAQSDAQAMDVDIGAMPVLDISPDLDVDFVLDICRTSISRLDVIDISSAYSLPLAPYSSPSLSRPLFPLSASQSPSSVQFPSSSSEENQPPSSEPFVLSPTSSFDSGRKSPPRRRYHSLLTPRHQDRPSSRPDTSPDALRQRVPHSISHIVACAILRHGDRTGSRPRRKSAKKGGIGVATSAAPAEEEKQTDIPEKVEGPRSFEWMPKVSSPLVRIGTDWP